MPEMEVRYHIPEGDPRREIVSKFLDTLHLLPHPATAGLVMGILAAFGIHKKEEISVLSLGAGHGDVEKMLREIFGNRIKITVVEGDPQKAKILEEKGFETIKGIYPDVLEELGNRKFDVVLALYNGFYGKFEEEEELFRKVHGLLKNGGIFIYDNDINHIGYKGKKEPGQVIHETENLIRHGGETYIEYVKIRYLGNHNFEIIKKILDESRNPLAEKRLVIPAPPPEERIKVMESVGFNAYRTGRYDFHGSKTPVSHAGIFIAHKGPKEKFEKAIDNLLYDRIGEKIKKWYGEER